MFSAVWIVFLLEATVYSDSIKKDKQQITLLILLTYKKT
ncbi:hypothetical protein LMOSA_11640 [Listeria monocytogenes str. Scott A]|nr:hypothetical protein LMOSA_11640 [Listeria monocytogenes str. Scott A]EXL13562.1 hypothetical protein X845_2143 [Listeria monocytogenes Lm_1824]KSZ44659.1 hypothetical protein AN945_59 [Listeria monocytogenes]CBY66344.1 hypothetical protein LMOL312_0266 [Listeria monocytogenes L312]CBY69175.1 hypothetical protein LMOATCC19117_0276 [Listeria monocytogenes ATCC 19117]CBY72048.1 hypothetical protein LMOSLCC2378_0281 [Listeria monocytogenes SLCC2378]